VEKFDRGVLGETANVLGVAVPMSRSKLAASRMIKACPVVPPHKVVGTDLDAEIKPLRSWM
jgi:hypothetical protein